MHDLTKRFSEDAPPRGEIVLLISGTANESAAEAESSPGNLVERIIELESGGLDAKTALKQAARELGMKRAEAYRLLVAQKNRRSK
ncbi:MAG: hypothetical protein ACMG6H_05945 [Acidobacteriota bacterium]